MMSRPSTPSEPSRLPPEILSHLFSFLPIRAIYTLRFLSRHFYHEWFSILVCNLRSSSRHRLRLLSTGSLSGFQSPTTWHLECTGGDSATRDLVFRPVRKVLKFNYTRRGGNSDPVGSEDGLPMPCFRYNILGGTVWAVHCSGWGVKWRLDDPGILLPPTAAVCSIREDPHLGSSVGAYVLASGDDERAGLRVSLHTDATVSVSERFYRAHLHESEEQWPPPRRKLRVSQADLWGAVGESLFRWDDGDVAMVMTRVVEVRVKAGFLLKSPDVMMKRKKERRAKRNRGF